jgi:hypothetical protein
VHPDKQYLQRDYNLYGTLSDGNNKAADDKPSPRHVLREFNVLRHTPCIVSQLWTPDLPHTMLIGMRDHLQKWIVHLLKTHERLNMYNAICLSIPAYYDPTAKYTSYVEDSQWNVSDRKELSRYLV